MMLLDYVGVFGWIYGKREEISKSGKFWGPHQGVACPHCGVAEREV